MKCLTESLIQVLSTLNSYFIKYIPSLLRCTSISEMLKCEKKKMSVLDSMKPWPLPIPVTGQIHRTCLNSVK